MKGLFIAIGVILIVLFVWGLIGSSEVSKIGNTCDLGINQYGNLFCWKWHQNIIGDLINYPFKN